MNNKILILTNSINGLFNFRKEVVLSLMDEGYKVIISTPDEYNERHAFFEEKGCSIVKTQFNRRSKNPLYDLKLLLSYIRLLREIKPKAVLTYTIKPNVYGGLACRLLKMPQIVNVTGLGDAIENEGWVKHITLMLYKLGTKKAWRIFFQNKSNLVFFVKNGFDANKSVLLPGSGVNLLRHNYQPYPPCGIIKFLYAGRLLKDKGVEEYFKMAELIKRDFSNVEFGIVGKIEDNYKKQMENLVSNDIIKYYGLVPDVRPFYRNSHCVVLPSYHEGMSNVNLESAANGRPVITTNVPGCKETVDDKVTGYLCLPMSVEDLTEKVKQFIQLPYEAKQNMGKAARLKVEREFDRQIVVKAYMDAINQLV